MAKRSRNSTQPRSSRGTDDANDDANDANWLHKDYENQEYGEDEFIDETPRVDVTSDDSGEENIPKHNPKRNPKHIPKNRKLDQADLRKRINPARRGEGKGKAPCWVAFDTQWIREEDGVEKKYAECLFCMKLLKADGTLNGTTGLNRHWRGCKANPENQQSDDDKQSKLSFKKDPTGEGHVYTWKHDEVRIAKAILGIFTIGELPFKWLENEACIELVNALNGRVILPSRHTASRNVAQLYLDERSKLLKHLSNPNTAVHSTTDTWTSPCQRKNYMVLTAHFIDDDWVMHKRVVNFREVDTHKGEDMVRELLVCIHEWGMKKVMSMTVDNAKSNDVAIKYLVKKLPNVYDNGNQFHIRCMAHIINLIVKMGLKRQNYHVECVQNAVKYIRGSMQRIKKFKKAMKDVAVDTKRFLCGETPTRWNSTFELLTSAYDVRDAFVEFGMQEKSFEKDVDRVPEFKDFEEIKKTIDFLEKIKTKTEKVSCSTKPLIHQFTREILDISLHLTNWSLDPGFVEMVPGMKEKYDKYWGDYEKMSDFVFFAVLLDPQCKSQFLLYTFREMIKYTKEQEMTNSSIELKAREMVRETKRKMDGFFKTYLENYDTGLSSQQQTPQQVVDCDDGNDFFGNYLSSPGVNSRMVETELESYLNEPPIKYSKNFDILSWWKLNGLRYPMVAQMAKDLLGIQISTVASESTFSTGRRVITDYRSNLSVGIVEALICTADWTRKSRMPIMDNVDDILNDDDVAIELEEAIHNNKAMGKRPMMN
ncbi:hypothetical protein LXL04_019523 [Taraxacum kok-saghyz]